MFLELMYEHSLLCSELSFVISNIDSYSLLILLSPGMSAKVNSSKKKLLNAPHDDLRSN